VRLAQNGVSPEFVERVRIAGYTDIGVSELIRMSQQGLLPRYKGKR
jgi:hypothetical protein